MKQILLKSWLTMLCLLVFGVGKAWAEDATMTAGTNGSTATVNSKSAIKVGTSSKGGDMTITVPSGATSLEFYAAAWSGVTGLSLNITPAANVSPTSVSLTADTGISGNSPFTLSGTESSYKFTIALSNITAETEIKLTSSTTKRFVVWGATYSSAADTRAAVNMTGFSATSTTLIKGETTTTAVTNDQNGWTPAYTYESSNTNVATVSNTGVITAVAKGTAKITASLNIANDDANWKKGATASKTIDITVNNPSHTALFSVNGTINDANNQIVEEGSQITFPANPQANDVEFIGWTKNAITGTIDNAPSDICTSATMGAEDVTYYAVFAEATVGNTFTQITALNALEAGARYLIVGNSSSTYKALPVDKAETLTTVTPSSSKITNPAEELIWTLEGTAKNWKIKSVSNGKYLQISGGNLTFESSTSLTFDASVSSSKFTFTSSATSGNKVLSYYASGSKFNAYTSANNVYLYKASVDYSDYRTTVKAVTGVAIKTAPTTVAYCEGEKFNPAGLEVTLTYEDETTKDVAYTDATASKFTFAPALDAALTTSDDHVSITINGQTCNQTISVRSVSIAAPVVVEGAYTVKVGDAEAVTADGNTINALKGQKIVLASAPAAGYKVASTPFVVTDEDDANVSISTAGGQYSFTMPGKNVTIAAKFTQVFTITAGSCEHGSIAAIKDASGNALTETSKGSTVKVEATADTHYHLTGMYYVKENEETQNVINENEGVYSFTMPQSNVTVYATFADDTQYTISWMVNGAEAKSEQVYADVPVSAPAVDPINSKVFRGWVAEDITGTSDDAPSFVNVTNLTVNENKVFYAVFATEEGTPETHNIITCETENFPSSYAAAADYTLNGVSFKIAQAYVYGERTQWSASDHTRGVGIMYNNDAMDISKITLTYDNMDSKKNFTIKVGNSANPTSGTEITGVVDANDNKVYVFDCSSENASYFVLTNGTNAGYLASIDITCGGATYSDFTTAPCGIAKISIGQYEYATLVAPCNLDLEGTGVTAYAITSTDLGNSVVRTTEVTKVPAGKPIIVHGAQGDYNIHGIAEADDFETMLEASESVVVYGEDTANDYYYLGVNGDKVCFKKLTSGSLAAGKCFFKIAKGSEVKMFSMIFNDDDATGISSVENVKMNNGAVYNLAGQRVNANAKGIVIVNGKKMLNK